MFVVDAHRTFCVSLSFTSFVRWFSCCIAAPSLILHCVPCGWAAFDLVRVEYLCCLHSLFRRDVRTTRNSNENVHIFVGRLFSLKRYRSDYIAGATLCYCFCAGHSSIVVVTSSSHGDCRRFHIVGIFFFTVKCSSRRCRLHIDDLLPVLWRNFFPLFPSASLIFFSFSFCFISYDHCWAVDVCRRRHRRRCCRAFVTVARTLSILFPYILQHSTQQHCCASVGCHSDIVYACCTCYTFILCDRSDSMHFFLRFFSLPSASLLLLLLLLLFPFYAYVRARAWAHCPLFVVYRSVMNMRWNRNGVHLVLLYTMTMVSNYCHWMFVHNFVRNESISIISVVR